MRIIWSANAPWCHTGYGVQGKYLLPRMHRMGHETACCAWYGLEGGSLTIQVDGAPIKVYPKGTRHWGLDVLPYYIEDFGADLVLSLQDVWVLPPTYKQTLGNVAWAVWFPVDHDPIPDKILTSAKAADFPITYSKWGREIAKDAGLDTTYIPHAVDTTIFSPGDKIAARQELGLPLDAYIVAMVAANKGFPARKSFPEALLAFAKFAKSRADINPVLYVHCDPTTTNKGVDLIEMAKSLGIERRVKYAPRAAYITGLPDEYVANVYRAADVKLLPSRSEGFGLPIIEAQACGTPVITSRFASMTELTVNGVSVPPVQPWWSPLNAWQATASAEHVYRALEEVASWDQAKRDDMAAKGRQHVVDNYDWDVVAETHWRPFLEWVERHVAYRKRGRIVQSWMQYGKQKAPAPEPEAAKDADA